MLTLKSPMALLVSTVWFVITTALSAAAQPSASTEIDPVIGTWRLDVAHSQYSPGPPPKAEVRIYEPDHEGVKTTIRTQRPDGQATTVEYIASYNEVIAAVTGSTTVDAIQMKKIDELNAEAVLRQGGTVVGTARRTISRDGLSMTITLMRKGPTPVSNVAVYRRMATP